MQLPTTSGRTPGAEPPLPQDPLPPPEEISGTLRDILAGPDFATFEAPERPSLAAELIGLLEQLLNWIMSLMQRDTSGLLQALAVAIPLLVLVAAGVIVIRRRRDAVQRTARGRDPGEEARPVTASEWLRLASEHAGKGYLRSAATALYEGFLLTLDGRGALAYHPSKTPGDYTREISRSYGAGMDGRAGGRFLSSFQGFTFGQDSPTDDAYAALTRLAREAGCGGEPANPGDKPANPGVEHERDTSRRGAAP